MIVFNGCDLSFQTKHPGISLSRQPSTPIDEQNVLLLILKWLKFTKVIAITFKSNCNCNRLLFKNYKSNSTCN